MLHEFDEQTTSDQRTKHVYAVYGLAVFHAQCLEAELISFAVAEARASGRVSSIIELDEFDAAFSSKTLGGMLNRVRKIVEIDAEVSAALTRSLESRNQLIHGYFYRNSMQFMNENGQRGMIEELCVTCGVLRFAEWLVSGLTKTVCKHLGISEQSICSDAERLANLARAGITHPNGETAKS